MLLQSCLTLCNPIDSSPPGSSVPGILQARTVEWVAISFSNAWEWKVKVKSFSHVRLFVTPWTVAYQSPPSMGFTRQEYWSGMPLPSPSGALFPSKLLGRNLKRNLDAQQGAKGEMEWGPTMILFLSPSPRGILEETICIKGYRFKITATKVSNNQILAR